MGDAATKSFPTPQCRHATMRRETPAEAMNCIVRRLREKLIAHDDLVGFCGHDGGGAGGAAGAAVRGAGRLWRLAVAALTGRFTAISSPNSSATGRGGLIGEAEAEAARNEISRRLLAGRAAGTRQRSRQGWCRAIDRRGCWCRSWHFRSISNPAVRGCPMCRWQARLKGRWTIRISPRWSPRSNGHLGQNPDDVEGWKVLAPAYKRERRWQDAANAYANVLRLVQPDADTIADYGEMLVFANEGMVTAEAARAFADGSEARREIAQGAILRRPCLETGRPESRGAPGLRGAACR